MLKKGIPAKDLRPFSIEDPYGLGIPSATQQRLHQRFHRKSEHRQPSAPRVARVAVSHVAREALKDTQRLPPPPRPAAPTANPKKGVAKSVGCLTTLLVIGALYGIGSFFIPLLWNALEQEIVLHTGNNGYGKIITAQATNAELNENEVFAITLLVHIPGYDPYTVEIEQALTDAQVRHLKPETWVELRYDPDDMRTIAIQSVGIPEPNLSPSVQGAPDDKSMNNQPDPAASDPRAADPSIPGDVVVAPRTGPTDAADNDANSIAPEPPDEPSLDRSAPSIPTPPDVEAKPSPSAAPPLVCLQARACCQIAGGGACTSFSAPGVDPKSCRKALRGFGKLAEASGKTCSGLP